MFRYNAARTVHASFPRWSTSGSRLGVVGLPSFIIVSGHLSAAGLWDENAAHRRGKGTFVILSAGRVNCAERPDCEVALFLPEARCYIASASWLCPLDRLAIMPVTPTSSSVREQDALTRVLIPSPSAHRVGPFHTARHRITAAERDIPCARKRAVGFSFGCRLWS